MRVLIADDHELVRRGLRAVLMDEFAGVEIGEAGDTGEALALIRSQQWDVAVLDITMPGRGGLYVLEELRRASPRTPAIVLSMHPEDQYAVRALRAGADGYLTKEAAPDRLVDAVRKVLGGGKFISDALAERLVSQLGVDPDRPLHDALSDREFQVMKLIASGKTVGEIAEQLSLSAKTISTYRARLLEKMSMRTNAEVTRYAIEHGLAD
jgi:DNA-binding NarL/FixJ family response regulator